MKKSTKSGVAGRVLSILKKVILYFFIGSIALVILYRFIPPPITPLMLIRVGEQIFDSTRDVKLKKNWESYEKISPHMPLAIIAAEDQNFKNHWGFDVKAIEKAYRNNNKKKRKTIKGASTISQQLAKNVFLWPARSYVRKAFEAYFTVLIELLWSKKRIMEVYMNVVEMGEGIYGVEAASQKYFHKPASALTRNEAALIAAVLPNPRKWSPAKPSSYIRLKQRWIKRNMGRLKDAKL